MKKEININGLNNEFKDRVRKIKKEINVNKLNYEFKKLTSFSKDELFKEDKKVINSINEFFQKEINSNYRVWALLGNKYSQNDVEEDKYICLQVGSSSTSIKKEIRSLIKCMLPFNKDKDKKMWSSYFYKDIFEVSYGLDSRSQKYNHIYENFEKFYIIVIDEEKYLNRNGFDKNGFDKRLFTEVMYAYENGALYWNPIKEEYKILSYLKERNKNI